MNRCKTFFKQEFVLCIAAVLAVASMFWNPPSPAYAGFIDFRVLMLLFCLMAVVAGLRQCGLFDVLAQHMLQGRKNIRALCLMLVLLPFFTSMLITNDVALITFVPFAILILQTTSQTRLLIWIITLQTVAANLGSMFTPFGNPQNLYLYNLFQIPLPSFFATVALPTILSLAALIVCACCVKGENIEVSFRQPARITSSRHLMIYIIWFAVCLLSVFRLLPAWILLLALLAFLSIWNRSLLRQVDYSLLLTFVCFFVFVGNLGSLPAVRSILSSLLNGREVIVAALSCPAISNVPAAVLLSGFTDQWRGLLLGVNLGGLGTIIAFMASLISFKYYLRTAGAKPLRYLAVFTLTNAVWLAVLLLLIH